jgi:hypothetical protein
LAFHSSNAVHAVRQRALEQLTQLYDALNQPDEAVSWRLRLEQLDQPVESDSVEAENTDDRSHPSAKPPPD